MEKTAIVYNVHKEVYEDSAAWKAALVYAPVALSECYVEHETKVSRGVSLHPFSSDSYTKSWREEIPAGFVGTARLTEAEARFHCGWQGNWEVREFTVTGRTWAHGTVSSPKTGRVILKYKV